MFAPTEAGCITGTPPMRHGDIAGTMAGMDIATWWPLLSADSRDWLVEHNGEPLDPSVRDEILAVNGGETNPDWWAGESTDGESELTDSAIDWIEEFANGEQ